MDLKWPQNMDLYTGTKILQHNHLQCLIGTILNPFIFRIYTSNFDSMVVIADPILAMKLYSNQANMAHSWDQGLGHFVVRYIGKCMGFAKGDMWIKHRRTFRSSLSSTAADGSLANITATLDDWENNVLEPLAMNGEAIGLHELVGMMPVTLMLKIYFGDKFINNHIEDIQKLSKDADFIMNTIIHNQNAATSIYQYFDTPANK